MERAYKFRLYPTREQEATMDRTLGLCRRLYNACLEQRRTAWRQSRRSVQRFDQQAELPALKEAFPEYLSVHSQVLQAVVQRADLAFQGFFQTGRGYPRFKGRNRYRSFTYPQSGFEVGENGRLWMSKIGAVRMFQHRPLEGRVCQLTILKDEDRWFAVFTVDGLEKEPTPATGKVVGVDLGLENIVALSDGTTIEPPKFFRKAEKRLARAQRRLSRKQKGSKNRDKARLRVARLHRKVRLQRLDFAHKVSHFLVQNYDAIGFEALNVAGMARHPTMAKSIHDAGWSLIRTLTTYKAGSAGRFVGSYDPWGTSQRCSGCGREVKKTLAVRIHACPFCGLVVHRDANAAKNVELMLRQEIGRGTAEYTPGEIGPTPTPEPEKGQAEASPVAEPGSPAR